MVSLTRYEHAALDQVRFLAQQYGSDPVAFGHTLEVVKERYRIDPYIKSDPVRWDTVLSQAETEDDWPFRREVKREGTQMKTTFHEKPKHSGGCSNQNVLNPFGAYVGVEECGCRTPP